MFDSCFVCEICSAKNVFHWWNNATETIWFGQFYQDEICIVFHDFLKWKHKLKKNRNNNFYVLYTVISLNPEIYFYKVVFVASWYLSFIFYITINSHVVLFYILTDKKVLLQWFQFWSKRWTVFINRLPLYYFWVIYFWHLWRPNGINVREIYSLIIIFICKKIKIAHYRHITYL